MERIVKSPNDINRFRRRDGSDGFDFSDVVFNCEINFSNKRLSNTTFQNAIFEKTVKFNKTIFLGRTVLFSGARFKKSSEFNNSQFPEQVYFDNSIFEEDVSFIEINTQILSNFSNIEFHGVANFYNAKFIGNVDFSKCKFHKGVIFKESFIKGSANFSEINTELDADYFHAKFKGELLFENANFKKNAIFSESLFDKHTKFSNSIFFGDVNFKGAEFSHAVNFYGAEFGGERNDFILTKFKRALFNKAVFKGNTFFDSAKFEEEAVFDEIQFSNKLQFRSTQFNKNSNFRFIKTKTGKIYFNNAAFNQLNEFINSEFKYSVFKNVLFKYTTNFTNSILMQTDFTGAIFKEIGLFKNCEINTSNRETFRIVKHELLKLNNKIDALIYHKKEMKAYWKELWKGKWYKNIPEKFILFMNRISNGFGLNWLRGIGFTFIVALLFFIPYLFCLRETYFQWGWVDWPSFWDVSSQTLKYYVEFFYAAHKFNFMEQYEPNGIAYVLDMVGRIFITYGYYQTIQAFRKFGRW